VVFANGSAVPTTFVNANQVSCLIGPSILQALHPGAIGLIVKNAAAEWSNTVALVVDGPWSNQATISAVPPGFQAGDVFSIVIEGGSPNAPLTVVVDLDNFVPPSAAWPTPAVNYVLGVDPAQFMILPGYDGLGIGGPPTATAFGPGGGVTPPGGVLQTSGIVAPNPPLGIAVSVQAAFVDQTAPQGAGVRLTWTLMPLNL
jgi:hypothetical protein